MNHHNLKFKNTYRIESTRLRHWDYGSHGFYFITICTQNKENYFGDVVETQNFALVPFPGLCPHRPE
jgi:putative transposase